MTELNFTISKARDLLAKQKISALELVEFYLQRIAKYAHLNAFITETGDHAIRHAKESDARRKAGNTLGLLEGIPLGVKDLYCTKGIQTTAGSKILNGFIPPYESTVTQNLWNQGAILLGKLNMDEFAMGSANTTSYFGPCINPWRSSAEPQKDLVPGGSSGGSAVAVAANLCLGATASDTGGSIRQPASFCGVVGIKPTYGLCSRRGMVAFASSLDQAGPIAKTVREAALLLHVMAGHDPLDSTSLTGVIPPYLENLNSNIAGMKIGIPIDFLKNLPEEAEKMMQSGIEWLKSAGCIISDVYLPHANYALPAYYIIAPAEASANLARYDGVRYGLREHGATLDAVYENTRSAGFGIEVKRRIMMGTYVLSSGYYDAYYTKAQAVQRLISNDFETVFNHVDLILTPTTTGAAFGMHEKDKDPISMYLNDIFTVPVNLVGIPAISIPAGLSANHLPLGLQLIGPKFSEQNLFNAASVIEEAACFTSLTL